MAFFLSSLGAVPFQEEWPILFAPFSCPDDSIYSARLSRRSETKRSRCDLILRAFLLTAERNTFEIDEKDFGTLAVHSVHV